MAEALPVEGRNVADGASPPEPSEDGRSPVEAAPQRRGAREAADAGSGAAVTAAGQGIEITKTVSPALPRPGQQVVHTVELRNTGDTDRPDLTFSDDLSGLLDDADFDHDESATSGTVSFAEPTLSWTGDVAAGQTVTVTYGVTVNDPPAGNLRLSGELVGPDGSNCAAGSTDPACGNLRAPGLPLLYILMTADRERVDPGGVVAYTVTVGNVGTEAYPGAALTGELSRVLDDASYNGDARTTNGTVSYGGSKLAWTGDIPAGETVTITYSVTVDASDAGDGVLDSTVHAPGGGTSCPGSPPGPARRAAPVPGAALGCAQRVTVEGLTTTGTLASETAAPVPALASAPVPAPTTALASASIPALTTVPITVPTTASSTVATPEPSSGPGSVPASGPDSAADSGADSGAEPFSDPGPVASPVSPMSEPAAGPVPVPSRAPLPAPGHVPVAMPGPDPVRAPVPVRVPETSPVPPGPGRNGHLPMPCPAGGPCAGPARPVLPFTGLALGPVLAGFLLVGLGLALRACTRRVTFRRR